MRAEIEEHLGRDVSRRVGRLRESAIVAAFAAELEPVDGVAAAVDAIQAAGYATCVASSGDHGKIRRNLAKTGLLDRFGDRLFSGDDVVNGKPAPDLFLHAAAAMGVEPARAAVVEDSRHGVEAARAAGMWVFAYTSGVTPAAALAGSADHPVRRHAVAAGADRGGRARRLSARRGRRLDDERLAERPERQRRQGDHDHGQRHLPSPMLGCAAGRAGLVRRDAVARPGAEHVAADDGRQLDRPDEARAAATPTTARRTRSRSCRCPSPAGADRRGRRRSAGRRSGGT